MPHTYATVGEANDYLVSGGAVALASETAATVALKLAVLESVSRRIDDAANRTDFETGFGPRIGTNSYDGTGASFGPSIASPFRDTSFPGIVGQYLSLRDDLLTVSAITLRMTTAATTSVSPVADTDYFLLNEMDQYSPGPYRKVLLHAMGTINRFGFGYKVTDVAGTWGHQNVTVPSTTTVASGLSSGTTATTFTTSATPTISPGMTLLVGTEQLYLSGLASTAATVVRGANGTTAATHIDTSAIARYVYDSRVHDVCLRLFARRWKARDAGADGSDGGGQMPGVVTHEGEDTIIRRGLGNLVLKSVY